MSINTFWITIKTTLATIGGVIAGYLGGLDGLIYALIIFVITDYLTGVLAAINEKRISSAVGFRGISRKVLIFTLIGIAHLLDTHILGTPGVLRAATIFFYLANEGISLTENATRLGLPVPDQIRTTLDTISHQANQNKPPLTKPATTNQPEPFTGSTHQTTNPKTVTNSTNHKTKENN